MQNKPILLTVGALGLLALQGCSTLGIGESDYACDGMPQGVRCMSAKDVYAATEGTDHLRGKPVDGDTSAKYDDQPEDEARPDSGVQPGKRLERQPALPAVKGPVPLRTPSGVMRIRLNFWEDKEGDLHVPGYIYTEVETRRWQVGMPTPESDPVLRPLSVSEPDNAEKTKQGPQNRPGNGSTSP